MPSPSFGETSAPKLDCIEKYADIVKLVRCIPSVLMSIHSQYRSLVRLLVFPTDTQNHGRSLSAAHNVPHHATNSGYRSPALIS